MIKPNDMINEEIDLEKALCRFTCKYHFSSPKVMIQDGDVELFYCCSAFKAEIEETMIRTFVLNTELQRPD